MIQRFSGVVCWFNAKDGFGFLNWSKDGAPQKDMFVHFSDISMDGYRTLKKDQRVSFAIGLNNRGQPKAVDVVVE